MSALTIFRRNPVMTCINLVFIISWGLIIVLAGVENLPIDPEKSIEILPLLYIMMLLGPGVAGILMNGLVNGRKGLVRLKNQLLNWRLGFRWYLLALLTAPVIASLLLVMLNQFSAEFSIGLLNSETKGNILFTGLITGVMVGLFEEISWSGFIIPRLRNRYSIFNCCVGVKGIRIIL